MGTRRVFNPAGLGHVAAGPNPLYGQGVQAVQGAGSRNVAELVDSITAPQPLLERAERPSIPSCSSKGDAQATTTLAAQRNVARFIAEYNRFVEADRIAMLSYKGLSVPNLSEVTKDGQRLHGCVAVLLVLWVLV